MNNLNQAYSLSISYHQITVYTGSETPPVIDWTDDDILQGFATGDQGVSFEGVNNGKASIMVTLNGDEPQVSIDRAITVSFTHVSDQVYITSVMAHVLSFSIPEGDYQLTCSTSQQPDQDVYYVNFQTM